ncbi:hypothetical protein ACLMJK_008743 [Lecanora helva]
MSRSAMRPLICLRATSRLSLRSTPNPRIPSQTLHRPKSILQRRTYTSPSQPPPRQKPNYTLAILCGLTAVAATYAVTRPKALHLDAPPPPPSTTSVETSVKDHHPSDIEQIPTGNTSVPFFPQKIYLPRTPSSSTDSAPTPALPSGTDTGSEVEEYTLLGLGTRRVSLFRISVYIVGFYISTTSLPHLQQSLIHSTVGNNATTLVADEKDALRKTLLDGEGSMRVWGEVLGNGGKDAGVNSAWRVVPVRQTDWRHLREGWVRGVEGRGRVLGVEGEGFESAKGVFKSLLGGRGRVGKGEGVVLGRDGEGGLRVWVEEGGGEGEEKGKGGMQLLGEVKDERISRLLWLTYLGGAASEVASEEARASVVDGVMGVVERPVGTVETQVI